MYLDRFEILAIEPKTKEIELPRGKVKARELKSSEVSEFSRRQKDSEAAAIAFILVTAISGFDDKPLFLATDADAIAELPYSITDAMVETVLQLSGLRTDQAEKK